ncbi:MAG: alpha/beta hydrolase [Deltaproteobacteria bacterium]|nr:alpha/beta hydrolase [Deltaproteobacteria bacterium]MBW2127926.1 alpha/beta hydrolase [Deltaproteobacteria bacterium]MBW2304469.1 alpha/beta hydrolase [Deltaproteobacteria bacterium]
MAEETVYLDCEDFKLEGLLEERPGERALIMCHPHSLYGGEMHNQVVEAVIRAYAEKGYTTLRFNFRGVGGSGGSYGEGIAETKDVKAALGFLWDRGKKEIDLGGYSFGAWVCARGLDDFEEASRLIMVSPPVSAMDMGFLTFHPKIKLVIAGSRDDIGDPTTIQEMVKVWNPDAVFKVIEGADHFYGGKTDRIQSIIREFLERAD